ncbi:MAG: hypothetical protein M3501_00975 [Actinomycetota bacterium]|nr:hypothetical protein [Actinomycetota bacterium]
MTTTRIPALTALTVRQRLDLEQRFVRCESARVAHAHEILLDGTPAAKAVSIPTLTGGDLGHLVEQVAVDDEGVPLAEAERLDVTENELAALIVGEVGERHDDAHHRRLGVPT